MGTRKKPDSGPGLTDHDLLLTIHFLLRPAAVALHAVNSTHIPSLTSKHTLKNTQALGTQKQEESVPHSVEA